MIWKGYNMRRLFLALASLVFLVSCGPSVPPPMPVQLAAEAQVRFGESRFTAQVAQEHPGALMLEFTAPEELQGMRLSLQGDNASLRYGELDVELPANALPAANAAALLNHVLLRLAQPGAEGFTRVRGGGWTLKGTANGLHYQANINAEGVLTQIEAPSAALEIKLYD